MIFLSMSLICSCVNILIECPLFFVIFWNPVTQVGYKKNHNSILSLTCRKKKGLLSPYQQNKTMFLNLRGCRNVTANVGDLMLHLMRPPLKFNTTLIHEQTQVQKCDHNVGGLTLYIY